MANPNDPLNTNAAYVAPPQAPLTGGTVSVGTLLKKIRDNKITGPNALDQARGLLTASDPRMTWDQYAAANKAPIPTVDGVNVAKPVPAPAAPAPAAAPVTPPVTTPTTPAPAPTTITTPTTPTTGVVNSAIPIAAAQTAPTPEAIAAFRANNTAWESVLPNDADLFKHLKDLPEEWIARMTPEDQAFARMIRGETTPAPAATAPTAPPATTTTPTAPAATPSTFEQFKTAHPDIVAQYKTDAELIAAMQSMPASHLPSYTPEDQALFAQMQTAGWTAPVATTPAATTTTPAATTTNPNDPWAAVNAGIAAGGAAANSGIVNSATTPTTTAPVTTAPVTPPATGGLTPNPLNANTGTQGLINNVSQNVSSNFTLGPNGLPQSGPADTINPVMANVTDLQTVQGQLGDILKTGNPLLEAAKARAMQTANQRGLQNSSLAAQGGEEALLAQAEDIAKTDAATFQKQALTNQTISNEFLSMEKGKVIDLEKAYAAFQQNNYRFDKDEALKRYINDTGNSTQMKVAAMQQAAAQAQLDQRFAELKITNDQATARLVQEQSFTTSQNLLSLQNTNFVNFNTQLASIMNSDVLPAEKKNRSTILVQQYAGAAMPTGWMPPIFA